MDWSVTGGDLLQAGAFIVIAVVFVMKIDKQLAVMKAELKALEQRVNALEKRIHEDILEIKATLKGMAARMDAKQDK